MKFKLILVFLMSSLIIFLASCGNLYKVGEKDVEKIHKLVESLEPFHEKVPYLTNFGNVTAEETNESYKLRVWSKENKNGVYEYEKKENILYKDNVKLEEDKVFISLDEFVKYIVLLSDSTSYCISINEFIPLIKEIYLTSTDFKHTGSRGGKIYYSCEIKGATILNNHKMTDVLEKINNKVEIQADSIIKVSLLFSTDFTEIYPELLISLEDKVIFEFVYSE